MADEQNMQNQGMTQDTVSTVTADPAAGLQNIAPPIKAVQADIAKLKVAIATLEETGRELFQDEIESLKQKVVNLEAEAEEEAKAAIAEVVQVEQLFLQKYGQVTAHGIEIVLLAMIVGKIFGVI